MKRIVLVLASTVSVLVLLFGYHTSTAGPAVTASPPAVVSGGSSGDSGTDASGDTGTDASGDTSSDTRSDTGGTTTLTGDVAQTRWGPVQVEVTLDAGAIADVTVLQYPNGNPKDQQINAYALPILIQQTIDQQSADVDMISGATVTSVGYQQSLQSALDRA